eukprot:2978073-Pyramimonas_sp.AAC.1
MHPLPRRVQTGLGPVGVGKETHHRRLLPGAELAARPEDLGEGLPEQGRRGECTVAEAGQLRP